MALLVPTWQARHLVAFLPGHVPHLAILISVRSARITNPAGMSRTHCCHFLLDSVPPCTSLGRLGLARVLRFFARTFWWCTNWKRSARACQRHLASKEKRADAVYRELNMLPMRYEHKHKSQGLLLEC